MRNILNCVIIDDDHDGIEVLQDYISQFPTLNLTQVYTSPVTALTEVGLSDQVDLLFLDIDMPGISGVELAGHLKDRVGHIIFATAHREYAMNSYNLLVKYYLLKPFDFVRFASVISDVIYCNYTRPGHPSASDDDMYLRTGERGRATKVLKSEILYIQAASNYVSVQVRDTLYTTYMTLTEMTEKLKQDERFFRVHKSYIINKDHVKVVAGNTIDMGNHQVPMSSQYKNAFTTYIGKKTLTSKRL
jgi:Response regulator of the LytR/AlgR family